VSVDFINFLLIILIPSVTPSSCEVLVYLTDFFFFFFISILTPARSMDLIIVSSCSWLCVVLLPALFLFVFLFVSVDVEGVQVVKVVVDVEVVFVDLLLVLLVLSLVVVVDVVAVCGV
jgi:hypothetical protein